MAHETGWLVEGRVIYQRFYGVVTLKELGDAASAVGVFALDGTAPVHAIIDVARVERHPTAIGEIRRALRDVRFNPAHGWIIVVGANPLIDSIASVVIRIVGSRFRLFDTFEEALHFLAVHDAKLADLTPLPAHAPAAADWLKHASPGI